MAGDGGAKRIIYPMISLLAVVAAGYFLSKSIFKSAKSEMPDTAESASPFACTLCGHTAKLTPREVVELQEKGKEVKRAGSKEGGMTSMRQLIFLCPSCNGIGMRTATECPDCGTIYQGGDCPKCAPTAEEEEAAESPRPGRRRQ